VVERPGEGGKAGGSADPSWKTAVENHRAVGWRAPEPQSTPADFIWHL
jgi:hypothetical protein